MSAPSEFTSLPGGWLGVNLLRLGSVMLFVSLLFWVLSLGGTDGLELESEFLVFPAWGGLAVAFAIALRKRQPTWLKVASLTCFAFGLALALLVIFGTHISIG